MKIKHLFIAVITLFLYGCKKETPTSTPSTTVTPTRSINYAVTDTAYLTINSTEWSGTGYYYAGSFCIQPNTYVIGTPTGEASATAPFAIIETVSIIDSTTNTNRGATWSLSPNFMMTCTINNSSLGFNNTISLQLDLYITASRNSFAVKIQMVGHPFN